MRIWINTKGPGGAFLAYAPSLAIGAFVLGDEYEGSGGVVFCRVEADGTPVPPGLEERPDEPIAQLFLFTLALAHAAEAAAAEGRGAEA
jgi:hypothetical protein